MLLAADEVRRFRERLLAWYDANGRHELPWKQPATPYRVWVSEIMLQQTQVSVVIPYFHAFMERFPDAQALAGAPVDAVMAQWSGLGYYARARNLHRAAEIIATEHGGEMPADRDSWQALPGVGRSTAAAILSLSMGQHHAILDGNVKRVLARYGAIPGWPGRSPVERELWELSEQLTPEWRCADYNQAMMDLGATVCIRKAPACLLCPLNEDCRARVIGEPEAYPDPKPGKRLPVRRTRMLLLESDQGLLLQRRPPAGIWGGLWSLPEAPADDDPSAHCREHLGVEVGAPEHWQAFRHTFSHYHLDIEPVHLRVTGDVGRVMTGDAAIWYNERTALDRGLAAPVSRLLQQWHRGA